MPAMAERNFDAAGCRSVPMLLKRRTIPAGGAMRGRKAQPIGLAIVGAGRVGLFRGEVAARHAAVEWIGIAEPRGERAREVAARLNADFVTNDHRELLRRPEVTAAIVATDEH